jgi:hypothetical protein
VGPGHGKMLVMVVMAFGLPDPALMGVGRIGDDNLIGGESIIGAFTLVLEEDEAKLRYFRGR